MTHDSPSKTVYVQTQRKDGKLNVTYVFPISGSRLRKVISKDQLEVERSKGYAIHWATQS